MNIEEQGKSENNIFSKQGNIEDQEEL